MTTRPLDTSPAAWSTHNAVLDGMGGEARLRGAIELSDAVRQIRLAGIRAEDPAMTRQEAMARLVLEDFGIVLAEER